MTTGEDQVKDGEPLYRWVPKVDRVGTPLYSIEAGRLRFSSTAFNDRNGRPSVDRALLRNSNPHCQRRTTDDGVISLSASSLRSIPPISQKNGPGQTDSKHNVDVTAVPLALNRAHAEIVSIPSLTGSAAIGRFKDALARLAEKSGWCVEPGSSLPPWSLRLFRAVQHVFSSLGRYVFARVVR